MTLINKITTSNRNLFWSLLILLHILLMGALYTQFGFNYGNEGAKYIQQAQEILNGTHDWHFNYNSFYTTYELYVAGFLLCHIPQYFIFISTYALSVWAYFSFYNMLKKLINTSVAKIWISCMLLSPMLQYWHFNLFSESFFIALSLLYISVAFSGHTSSLFLKLIILGSFICLARPNAVFIISIVGIMYAYKYEYLSKKMTTIFTAIYLLLIAIGVCCFLPLPYKDFTVQLAGGAIYCGFPTLPYPTLPEGKYTLWHVYQYIYNTYGLQTLLELFLKKLGSFFITSRPYYSVWHNVANNAHAISYVLCLIPFFKWKNYNKEVRYFIITLCCLIGLNALMVGFIYNEWSERHTIQVFPFIFVGVAIAFDVISEKYFRKINSLITKGL